MYQLLTRRLPNLTSIRNRSERTSIIAKDLRATAHRDPESLAAIVIHCLEWRLSDRYASAANLLTDLQQYQAGHTVPIAHPQTRFPQWLSHGLAAAGVTSLPILGFQWQKQTRASRVHPAFPLPERYDNLHLAEWNLDGQPELILANSSTLRVITPFGENLIDPIEPDTGGLHSPLELVADIDADGMDEIFLRWTDGPNLAIIVRNQNNRELVRFTASGSFQQTGNVLSEDRNTQIHPALVADLDNDGRREFLAYLHTGHNRQPRALLCYDLKTGELLWRFDTGPQIGAIKVADIPGRDQKQIVLALQAVVNGHSGLDHRSDSHSYILALNHRGEEQWSVHTGDEYTYPGIEVVSGLLNEPPRIIAYVTAEQRGIWNDPKSRLRGDQHPGAAEIHVISPAGKTENTLRLPKSLRSLHVYDLDSDNHKEIVIVSGNGELIVTNLFLQPQHRRQIAPLFTAQSNARTLVNIHAIEDLDGDGTTDIIASITEVIFHFQNRNSDDNLPPTSSTSYLPRIEILASNLQTQSRYQLNQRTKRSHPFKAFILNLDDDAEKEILAFYDQAYTIDPR